MITAILGKEIPGLFGASFYTLTHVMLHSPDDDQAMLMSRIHQDFHQN